jgi:hypothetical protein
MNPLPGFTKFHAAALQHVFYPSNLPPRESIVFPKFCGTRRTVQVEHRFAALSDHMDMRRTMIIQVNHRPQPLKPENCRHKSILAYIPTAWVIRLPEENYLADIFAVRPI